MTTDGGVATAELPRTFFKALRGDPTHGPELAVLYAMGYLVPEVRRWTGKRAHTGRDVEAACRAVVRRTTWRSRRDGALTGTSFYVGMPAAMASTFLHQLLMVLEIATLHGRDPAHPARAAEILVIQGRYPTAADAGRALRSLPAHQSEHAHRVPGRGIIRALRQVPAIIGLRLRSIAADGVVASVIEILKFASYFVPVLGIPVCVTSSARTTRHLGQAARRYYAETAPSHDTVVAFPVPADRNRGVRRVVNLSLVASALVAAAASVVWVTVDHHAVRAGLLVIELAVVITFLRLWWITRPESATG